MKIFARRLALTAALCLAAPPAFSQTQQVRVPNGQLESINITWGAYGATAHPVTIADPLPVQVISGGGSATPFIPDNGALVSNTATTSSTAYLLGGTGATVDLVNNGLAAIHYRLGTTSGVTTLTSDRRINPGNHDPIARGLNTYIAVMTDAGAASFDVITGAGSPGEGPSTDTNNPAVGGCRASTTVPTASSDGATTAVRCTKTGGLITHPLTSPELVFWQNPVHITTTGETTFIASATSKNNVLAWKVCSDPATSVAVRADLKDATSGTTRDFLIVPASGGCNGQVLQLAINQTTANNNWTVTLSATPTSGGVWVSGQYIQ